MVAVMKTGTTMIRRTLVLFLLLLPFATGARAQGLPELSIIVENLPDSATDCGLSEALFGFTAERTLRDAKIRVVGQSNPFLYISPNVLRHSSGTCSIALSVSIEATVNAVAMNGFKPREEFSNQVYCRVSTLSAYGQDNRVAVENLLEMVQNNVRRCLSVLEF